MKIENIEKHDNCECEIRYRQFRGRDYLTPGLFCRYHDVFIDWLKVDKATELIQDGIPVTPYLDRNKTKKSRKQTSAYIKWHRRPRKKLLNSSR